MALRPDLDGLRVRMPGTAQVYIIDGGKKRLIPNMDVYGQLFRDTSNINLDMHLDLIDTGEPVHYTAILFRENNNDPVYFLDGVENHHTKRHVLNPEVMSRYNFAWERVQRLPPRAIPEGPKFTKEGPMG